MAPEYETTIYCIEKQLAITYLQASLCPELSLHLFFLFLSDSPLLFLSVIINNSSLFL